VRGRAVESISEQARARIIELLSEMLKRGGEGHVLAERVPAEVALSLELLYVLRRRAAGSCLEQSAAVQQRYDGQHACAGADLEDRKQVGEIVAQYVARGGNGVLAAADALERELHGVGRGHDVDAQAARVVLGE